MDLICQKWDLYYAEPFNSMLPSTRLHRLIQREKTTSCLRSSLNLTVVYQNIIINEGQDKSIEKRGMHVLLFCSLIICKLILSSIWLKTLW